MDFLGVLLAIVTAVFPIEERSDHVGYCPCEFEGHQVGTSYVLQHRTQGMFYTTPAAFRFFTGQTASLYRAESLDGKRHTASIRKLRYSWIDLPVIVLAEDREGLHRTGCWGVGR